MMKFCPNCGESVAKKIPLGDNRPRHVCQACNTIHYINPKIVAGTLPTFEDKILLCKRAIDPRKGFWTLPAGFMEMQETTEEAAIRETWEEAEAKVNINGLYSLINVPHIGQVHMFYLATVINGQFGVGEESLEVKFFELEEIPWSQIAFPTVKHTIQYYIEDRVHNHFPMRTHNITPSDRIKLSNLKGF